MFVCITMKRLSHANFKFVSSLSTSFILETRFIKARRLLKRKRKQTKKEHFLWVSVYLARKYTLTAVNLTSAPDAYGDGTATLRSHQSHTKVWLFAGQARPSFLSDLRTLRRALVRPWKSHWYILLTTTICCRWIFVCALFLWMTRVFTSKLQV